MTGCSNTCAAYSPSPGDNIIFRGGDVWHFGNSSLSPYVGGTSPHWNWNFTITTSNCQLDASAGTVVKTGCIYIGVDQTWYSGSSWTRPQMNMDNTQSTSYQACTYDFTSQNIFFISKGYVIEDNLEWLGLCNAGSSNAPGYITILATNTVEASNNYFHGWTLPNSSAQDQARMISCNGTPCGPTVFTLIDHNVFDGSDSSLASTPGKASGFALGVGQEISFNIFYHVSNVYIGGQAKRIHDNWGQYIFEPSDSTHGNLFEQQGSTTETDFYNNNFNTTNEGEGQDLYSGTGDQVFIFNNISYLYRTGFSGSTPVNGTDGSNCFLPENTGQTGSRTWQVFNNTLDYPCQFSQKNITLTQVTQNNHIIGFSPAAMSSLMNPTITDNGNEVYQTESVANGQGYTTTNNYAPTASGNATVHAGANLASICNSISDSVAAAACPLPIQGVAYNQTSHTAVANATPSARGSTWDSGAYQFSSSGGVTTISPTSANFGSVATGSSSGNTTFTLTNSSGVTVTGITITNVGGNTSDFVNVGTGSCGSSLGSGLSCTIIYRFTPGATGSRTTTLNVADSDSTSPQQASLSGTGVNPTAGTPVCTPAGGTYGSTQSVTCTASPSTVICYSTSTTPATNGGSGCTTGTLYSGAISVGSTATYYFIAGGTGYVDGPVSNYSYTISTNVITAPSKLMILGVTMDWQSQGILAGL
jgi:hypothetical protein